MISLNESRGAQCDVRLSLKTQDQTLMRQAMDGAGLTRWEAAVLPRVVEDIYFQGGLNRPWKDGQVRYQCVQFGCDQQLESVPIVAGCVRFYDTGSRLLAQCGIITEQTIVIVGVELNS